MDIQLLLNNKNIKSKEKTILLSKFVIEHKSNISILIKFAESAKDTQKAT
jgi:hypothetical protein